MKTIQYKGAVYVEAASVAKPKTKVKVSPHKKCAKGTHWNWKKNKCMKVSPALSNHIVRASKKTNHAKSMSGKAGKGMGHGDAYMAHKNASDAHYKAHLRAESEGFHGLATSHAKKSDAHFRRSLHHQKYMKSNKA